MIRYANPYTPGAGFMPAYLAGRDDVIIDAENAMKALTARFPQQSVIYYGLRGVGKTVLLNRLEETAEELDIMYEHIEISEKKDFITRISNAAIKYLNRISKVAAAKDLLDKIIDAIKSLNVKTTITPNGIPETEISFQSEFDIHIDFSEKLTDLFLSLGNAANKSEDTICFFIDEIQYLQKEELEALIHAIHRCNQKRLPIMIFGAGLPKIVKEVGDAKSYSERLFRFIRIDSLEDKEATLAITEPATLVQVSYEPEAVKFIISITKGYPYFIQEYCNTIWRNTESECITLEEVKEQLAEFYDVLDQGFFKVRYDRTTKRERDFIYAMVKCNELPCNINNVASIMKKSPTDISPIRAQLINKGLIFSTGYAEIDFTVPEFDNFLKRFNPSLQAE